MDFSKKRFIGRTDIVLDEVEATELKQPLGIAHIFCFEEWEAQQKSPNKIIHTFAAQSD